MLPAANVQDGLFPIIGSEEGYAIERTPLRLILDRTVVLLLGTIVGAAIGWAFQASPGAPAAAASVPLPMATGSPLAPAGAGAGEAALMRQYAGPFQQLEKTIAAGGRVRVGVFGDSFGDGVWWGMAHQLPSKAGFDVVKFSQPATGFTRYKSFNVEARAAEQLGDAPLDIAIISFGANDAQGIITPEGKYAKFMGPLWQQEVGGRVDRFVALMRRHHAMVYWVGLPRMAKESFDSEAMAVNDFYAARVTKLGVPFIDTRPIVSDANGQFAAYLDDPKTGKRTLMRAPDGIHMSMPGYLRITRGLADRIRTYTDAARTVAGTATAAATATAS